MMQGIGWRWQQCTQRCTRDAHANVRNESWRRELKNTCTCITQSRAMTRWIWVMPTKMNKLAMSNL